MCPHLEDVQPLARLFFKEIQVLILMVSNSSVACLEKSRLFYTKLGGKGGEKTVFGARNSSILGTRLSKCATRLRDTDGYFNEERRRFAKTGSEPTTSKTPPGFRTPVLTKFRAVSINRMSM